MKKDDISLGVLPMQEGEQMKKKEEEATKLNNLKELLESMMNSWGTQLEIVKMRAKMNKAYFDALVEAGFNEEQAISIIKDKGV